MEAIRISISREGNPSRHAVLSLGDNCEFEGLKTHLLANKAETDRVLFQLPQIEPHHPLFRRHPVPSVIQAAPGVALVREIRAARLFNERGSITSIDDAYSYHNPTFSAHLSRLNGVLHPLTLGTFIREIVELAYAPDTIISVFHTTPAVEQLQQREELLTLRTNY